MGCTRSKDDITPMAGVAVGGWVRERGLNWQIVGISFYIIWHG